MKQKQIKIMLAVGVGAAIGTFFRYMIHLLMVAYDYPLGTLAVNLIGSMLLGFFTGFFLYKAVNEWVKTGLITGLCGGLTTMSAFAADSSILLVNHVWLPFVVYLFLSVGGSLLAVILGCSLGNEMGKRRASK